jgi:hypothetical protein
MNYEEYRWKGIILIFVSIICVIIGISPIVGVKPLIFLGAVLSFYGIYWTLKYIEVRRLMKYNNLLQK